MKDMEQDVINPALMLAISRMKEHNNNDTQNRMVEEALNARYLVPCVINMAPGTEQETTRTRENTTTSICMIQSTDEKLYFMAFTDMGELKKWQDNENQNVMIMGFDKLADITLHSNSKAEGFVINPATTNVVFQKHVIEMIIRNRDKAIAEGKLRVMTEKEAEMMRREKEKEAAE
jgi:hypothetical protein